MYAGYKQDQPGYFSGLLQSQQQQKPASLEVETRRLLVDNRDRVSGNAYDFVVKFDEYEYVSSAELKMVCCPKVSAENYVVIDIAELNDLSLNATSSTGRHSYAVAHFDSSLLGAGNVKPIKDFWNSKTTFRPPKRKLDRFTIKVLKPNGNVVTTADTAGEANVSLMFELGVITTRRQ